MAKLERKGNIYYVGGKHVGIATLYKGHLAYITERDTTKHFFRKYGGYGLSTFILDELIKQRIKLIVIKEKRKDGTMVEIPSNIHWWKDYGVRVKEKDYDEQIVLPLRQINSLMDGLKSTQTELQV